jgi:hypothetical protein
LALLARGEPRAFFVNRNLTAPFSVLNFVPVRLGCKKKETEMIPFLIILLLAFCVVVRLDMLEKKRQGIR